jgi:hypothetical protein
MTKKLFLIGLLFSTLNTFSQIPNYVPSNGLVGWWPFNGNANDESGNGNNGTVNGATLTADRFGNANQAYGFDGVNDFINGFINNSNLSDLTFSVWMNTTNTSGGAFVHLGSDNGSPFCNGVSLGNFNAPNTNLDGHYSCIGFFNSNANFAANQWSHCTMVKENNVLYFYVNSILLSQVSTAGFINPDNNFWFGSTYSNYVSWFLGNLDDIGIWNRALTACEIQDLYHAQLGSQAISAGLDQSICAGDNVTLNGAGGTNYQWNNNVVDGQPFSPMQSNTYVVSAQDTLGCTGADTVMVTVLENASSTFTETALDSYTLNGQTYNQSGTYTQTIPATNGCDSIITLNLTLNFSGIKQLQNTEIVVYPNPATDKITINGDVSLIGKTYLVFDQVGKVVYKGSIDKVITSLSVTNFSNGVYTLQIDGQGRRTFVVRKE